MMNIDKIAPMISIVLPVYNAEQYLQESLNSILEQTYTDFELLVLDDGSTDKSIEIVEAYSDNRIRLFRGNHNFIATLNKGIAESRGKYIARMDADDVMVLNRLQKQVKIMEEYPDVAVCSSCAEAFGLQHGIMGSGLGLIDKPLPYLLYGNFLIHPATMIRKSFLVDNGVKYANCPFAEDYKMWFDIARHGGKFFVLPEALLRYRFSESQVSYQNTKEQLDSALSIQQDIMELLLNMNTYKPELLMSLYDTLAELNNDGLLSANTIFTLYHQLFVTIKQ
ncbi:MAG: glycosyltransferase [Prevotellaceae bacterium]|nr:glycosyltransferase [Prevotellaceae bacterium]